MKRMNEDKTFELITARVVEECGRRGISGAFVMAETEYPFNTRRTWIRLDGPFDAQKSALMSEATAKVNGMLSQRSYSRKQVYLQHAEEVAYKGKDGHRSENGKFFYAFSGAGDELDGEIERVAVEFHKSL